MKKNTFQKWFRVSQNRYSAIVKTFQYIFVMPVIQAKMMGTTGKNPDGDDLFFVSGFDKSGTTWLMNLLNSHPQLVCRGSGQFFNLFQQNVPYVQNPGGYHVITDMILKSKWTQSSGITWLTETGVQAVIKQMIADAMRSYRNVDGQLVGDKSTVQDFLMIKKVFPKAHLIGIVRDGRDVAVSFAHALRNRGRRDRFTDANRPELQYLQDVATGWSVYARHLHEVRGLIHVLQYESLLLNPLPLVADIFARMGVSADHKLVEQIVAQNSFENLSGGRKPGEEDRESFFRKGVSGDWVNYFTENDLQSFIEIAGSALTLWGYKVNRPT